jgi:hypothetical protein
MSNQKNEQDVQKRNDGEFDHLEDWVDAKENQNQSLRSGLLSFLKHIEKVEDEKLHRKG